MSVKRIAVAALIVALAAVVAWAVATRAGGKSGGTVFTGTTLDGASFELAAYQGKPVVVNFWASWCGWCAKEMPDLVAFAAAHPEVQVVGVDVNDQQGAGQQFVQQYGLPFPNVFDPDGAVFEKFESEGLPTTVFFDKDLNVRHKIVGATDRQGFEAGLQKAL